MAEIETPRFTARELVREIQRRGGRVLRFRHVAVTCLTNDPQLQEWLVQLGGKPYIPPGWSSGPDGGYWRAPGIREWDVYIHTIPVRGDETIWEAAKRNRRVDMKVVEP